MIRHIRDEKWTPSWDTRKGSGDSRKRAAAENRVDICIKDGRKNHTDREEGDTMRIPEHIGIIPDGNRRWAKQAGLAKEAGYAYGLTPGWSCSGWRGTRESGRSHIMALPPTTADGLRNRSGPFPPPAFRPWSGSRRSRCLFWWWGTGVPLCFPGRFCHTGSEGISTAVDCG